MASQRIRVGVIGASATYGWGQRAHLPAILALPEYELTAVCTSSPETAAASARAYGARLAFHDYRQMAAHPEVDLVVVCVRARLHYPMAKAALEAGKHVFAEWPLGGDARRARELASLARRRGVRTMVGLQAQGSPAVLHLRNLVAQGYVGKLTACYETMAIERYPSYRAARDWAADPEKGARVLMIHAGHTLDALCFCAGEFQEVSGSVHTHIPAPEAVRSAADVPPDAPDAVIASGVLENGAVATVGISTNAGKAGGWRLELYGTAGTLVASSPGIANYGEITIRGARAGAGALESIAVPPALTTAPPGVPRGTPFNVAQLYRRLAEAIREEREGHPSFGDAARRLALLEAIQRSSLTGRRQRLGPASRRLTPSPARPERRRPRAAAARRAAGPGTP